jgi:hypothetical protein
LVQGAFEFRFLDGLERLVVRLAYFRFGALAFLPKVEKNRKVLDRSLYLFVEFYPIFVDFYILQDLGSPLIVVPETRRQGKLFVPGDLLPFIRDVKDTSSRPPGGPSYLLSALVS